MTSMVKIGAPLSRAEALRHLDGKGRGPRVVHGRLVSTSAVLISAVAPEVLTSLKRCSVAADAGVVGAAIAARMSRPNSNCRLKRRIAVFAARYKCRSLRPARLVTARGRF